MATNTCGLSGQKEKIEQIDSLRELESEKKKILTVNLTWQLTKACGKSEQWSNNGGVTSAQNAESFRINTFDQYWRKRNELHLQTTLYS